MPGDTVHRAVAVEDRRKLAIGMTIGFGAAAVISGVSPG